MVSSSSEESQVVGNVSLYAASKDSNCNFGMAGSVCSDGGISPSVS
jgi:hypothetical protein